MIVYAEDIMTTSLATLAPDNTCQEALLLLAQKKITGAPVLNSQGDLIGVISCTDLNTLQLHHAESGSPKGNPLALLVKDVMTQNVITAPPQTSVQQLAQDMIDHNIHRIIILNPTTQKPVGIVSTYDILKYFSYGSTYKTAVA